MKAALLVLALSSGLFGCTKSEAPAHVQRAILTKKTGNTFELVPTADQPPYCQVFTTTLTGIIWLQTPTHDNLSMECPAGKPITGAPLRVPKKDGKVDVYVIFSDRRLEAGPLQLQVQEVVQQHQTVTAGDLRAPGRVLVDRIEFMPDPR